MISSELRDFAAFNEQQARNRALDIVEAWIRNARRESKRAPEQNVPVQIAEVAQELNINLADLFYRFSHNSDFIKKYKEGSPLSINDLAAEIVEIGKQQLGVEDVSEDVLRVGLLALQASLSAPDSSVSDETLPNQQLYEPQTVVSALNSESFSHWDDEWVADNVVSIQMHVKDGRHQTVLYPACGDDLLRVLVAYRADEVIGIDIDPTIVGRVADSLEKAGLMFQLTQNQNQHLFKIVTLNGDKVLRLIIGDAREIMADVTAKQRFDVLHVALPTGADTPIAADQAYLQELFPDKHREIEWNNQRKKKILAAEGAPQPDPKTGQYAIVTPAIPTGLNSYAYEVVSVGGFMVLGEWDLYNSVSAPETLLDMMGLKQLKITRRHPFTVRTSMYPSREELADLDRTGYIYQKKEKVPLALIKTGVDILELISSFSYILMELQRGKFTYVDWDGNPATIGDSVKQFFIGSLDELSKLIDNIPESQLSPKQAQTIEEDVMTVYTSELSKLIKQYQKFIAQYDRLESKFRSKQIDNQQFMDGLGLHRDQNGQWKSEVWPKVVPWLKAKSPKDRANMLAAYRQLAEFQIS